MATAQTAPQGTDPGAAVTPRPLVIVGGGEHARVVADAARSRTGQWRVIGYTDAAGSAAGDGEVGDGEVRDDTLEHLGDDRRFAATLSATAPGERPALVLGFGGAPAGRTRAVSAYGADATWAAVVHETAWVSPSATIGRGAVVLAGAVVNAGARIGDHAIVNSRAVVEHDVTVGLGSHIGPGAVIGGGTTVGRETVVGLGAAIRDHIAIGDRVVVGMGAVVVADVSDDTTVLGIPARARG